MPIDRVQLRRQTSGSQRPAHAGWLQPWRRVFPFLHCLQKPSLLLQLCSDSSTSRGAHAGSRILSWYLHSYSSKTPSLPLLRDRMGCARCGAVETAKQSHTGTQKDSLGSGQPTHMGTGALGPLLLDHTDQKHAHSCREAGGVDTKGEGPSGSSPFGLASHHLHSIGCQISCLSLPK